MKKLNLKNQFSDDDEKLIRLLKTSISQELSKQFVENTLEKLLILKTKQKKAHKPLKFPLYLMLFIGLILLFPIVLTLSPQISLPDSGLELANISFQLDSWYTLPLLFLSLVLISISWLELRLVNFRNPFA